MTDAELEGKVAQILSEREVVINIGSNSGVKKGMTFAILAATPLPIVDPDTGNDLGTIDREKVRVRVSEVQKNLAICETYRTITTGGPWPYWYIAGLNTQRTVKQTLKAEDSEYPLPLSEHESYVKVGDRVKLVYEPETTK